MILGCLYWSLELKCLHEYYNCKDRHTNLFYDSRLTRTFELNLYYSGSLDGFS